MIEREAAELADFFAEVESALRGLALTSKMKFNLTLVQSLSTSTI